MGTERRKECNVDAEETVDKCNVIRFSLTECLMKRCKHTSLRDA